MTRPENPEGGASAGSGRARGGSARPERGARGWYEANRRDIRFLLVFGLLLGGYYLLTLTPPIKHGFFPAYLRANARICGLVLGVLGVEVAVHDQAMVSPAGASIQVERGCDAVEPSALFISAVLASPVGLGSRLLAAVVGTLLLMVLNIVRVSTLFLVRVHWPSAFDTMHLDVWQALFIVAAIALWAFWASRAARDRAEPNHGPA